MSCRWAGVVALVTAGVRVAACLASVAGVVGVVGVVGCGSSSRSGGDPLKDALNPGRRDADRAAAVPLALDPSRPESDRMDAKRQLEPLLWSPAAAPEVKVAILRALLEDPSESVRTETREQMRALLPREPSRAVVLFISERAAEGGWADFVPPLVRSYSRPVPGVPEGERAERKALAALAPGQTPERVAWGLYLDPPDEGQTRHLRWRDVYQADAWGLLARLDADGSVRDELLRDPSGNGNPRVEMLRRSRSVFRALPESAEQIRWVGRLFDGRDAKNASWLSETERAIAGLTNEQAVGLALRHAEPVRWAASCRPEWLGMGRSALLSELTRRLSGRDTYERNADNRSREDRVPERIAETGSRMAWGDVLAALVLDEALSGAGVVETLWRYAEADRKDTTTEYGGVIEWDASGGAFVVVLYPPWAGQRVSDERFIASEDMVRESDRSLAHFHFHVKETGNARFAGPSDEDLAYAQSQGRTCVVLTSLSSRSLNADYFQPGRVVVDLGEVLRPAR
ncbi:MAG: hypothetical protein HRU70_02155 [Phycisphaeraceae bacterium]|nr:MAG: hypothetical protein HRU70_02155 [Phycisphaeraceae bacterium]